jgi:hypothetical protein
MLNMYKIRDVLYIPKVCMTLYIPQGMYDFAHTYIGKKYIYICLVGRERRGERRGERRRVCSHARACSRHAPTQFVRVICGSYIYKLVYFYSLLFIYSQLAIVSSWLYYYPCSNVESRFLLKIAEIRWPQTCMSFQIKCSPRASPSMTPNL